MRDFRGFVRCFIALFVLIACLASISCKKSDSVSLPGNFKNLPSEDQMQYLMANMPPDSLANFLCDAALGKKYDVRIELPVVRAYAYEHYSEDEIVAFESAISNYEKSLPLYEKVRFAKMAIAEDPDMYTYELGLAYVGTIRDEKKDIQQVSEELDKFRKECKIDKDFYKRFMKGFKTALIYDRHHDLDDKIYQKFISYPDTIQ